MRIHRGPAAVIGGTGHHRPLSEAGCHLADAQDVFQGDVGLSGEKAWPVSSRSIVDQPAYSGFLERGVWSAMCSLRCFPSARRPALRRDVFRKMPRGWDLRTAGAVFSQAKFPRGHKFLVRVCLFDLPAFPRSTNRHHPMRVPRGHRVFLFFAARGPAAERRRMVWMVVRCLGELFLHACCLSE